MTCDKQVRQSRGSKNTPDRFMLQKPGYLKFLQLFANLASRLYLIDLSTLLYFYNM